MLQATGVVWKLMVCLTLFCLANFLRALATKLLSTTFYRTAHFAKVKEALDKVGPRAASSAPACLYGLAPGLPDFFAYLMSSCYEAATDSQLTALAPAGHQRTCFFPAPASLTTMPASPLAPLTGCPSSPH
jgi:hypothetical protein